MLVKVRRGFKKPTATRSQSRTRGSVSHKANQALEFFMRFEECDRATALKRHFTRCSSCGEISENGHSCSACGKVLR